MEYALQVSGDYDTVLDAARFAEQHDLAALALIDHYLMSEDETKASDTPAHDAFVQLGALARETETVELVVLVSPVTFRHPAVLYKCAVTIDHLSGGRFKLGIGSGWFQREHEIFGLPYPQARERFTMLEDALAYVKAALDPSRPGFIGDHYRLEPFPLAPAPRGSLPLLVGGSGPYKTPTLAGRYADEYDLIETELSDIPDRIQRAREAAVAAERDPEGLLLSYNSPVLAFDSQKEMRGWIGDLAERTGRPPEELEATVTHTASLVGTWDQIHDKLQALEEAGISRYYIGYWDREWDRSGAERFLEGMEALR